MTEEFESSWWMDYITVLGYCVTWEVCNCGQPMMMIWPNGKQAGIFSECARCGEPTFTIVFIATVN